LRNWPTTLATQKIADAKQMIDGPAGVPKDRAAYNPPMAATTPVNVAQAAMVSGPRAIRRALAAGMINMAVINKAPIALIDTATTAASNACQRQRNNEDTQRDQRRKQQRQGSRHALSRRQKRDTPPDDKTAQSATGQRSSHGGKDRAEHEIV
jgi:hypothetical protein